MLFIISQKIELHNNIGTNKTKIKIKIVYLSQIINFIQISTGYNGTVPMSDSAFPF